jgi:hypothetical protein
LAAAEAAAGFSSLVSAKMEASAGQAESGREAAEAARHLENSPAAAERREIAGPAGPAGTA